MAELAYQTYERVTGKPWATAKANGLTDGSASSNLALQSKLNGGWNPFSTPTAAPAPSAPAATPASGNVLDPYIAAATAQVTPEYDAAGKAIQTSAEKTKSTYDTLATQQLAREPLVRQTYKNLAAEFSAMGNRETNVAARIGEQNIGGARTAVAATGAENTQGAFQAPVTAQQDKLMADIGSIADKYNLKQETLTSEMNSSLQDLYDKADQYRITGDAEYSKAMVDLAQLKIQQKKDILEQAQWMFGADEEVKKFEYQIEQDKKQWEMENKKFEEQQRQFAISEANQNARSAASLASAAADRVVAAQTKAAGAYTVKVKKDNEGLDFYDENNTPVSPWKYFSTKGATLDEVKRTFAQSQDPQDQTIIASIDLGRRLGQSDNTIYAGLQSKYKF